MGLLEGKAAIITGASKGIGRALNLDATVFFCSDMARSVSGQVLAVNAGEPAG
jgi:hypothetical protein